MQKFKKFVQYFLLCTVNWKIESVLNKAVTQEGIEHLKT